MRRLYTLEELANRGVSQSRLRWAAHQNRVTLITRGVWGAGPEPPSVRDRAVAEVLATQGVASQVFNRHGLFVARVDLSWLGLGMFTELDGQQHKNQPVYDASRETAVVAATGWLCARLTWTEVKRFPRPTASRLADIVDQARRRPLVG